MRTIEIISAILVCWGILDLIIIYILYRRKQVRGTSSCSGTVADSAVSFTANFKDLKKEVPIIKDGITVKVYFICEGVLYKGEYHTNNQFYAYDSSGRLDCFASISGNCKTWGGERKNKICTHWCYVSELKMVIDDAMQHS